MTDLDELAKALAKAQGEMSNAPKDATNPHFKAGYATLASLWDAIRIPLSSNGLCITQTFVFENEMLLLVTSLIHSSGQYIVSKYPIIPIKTDPQGYGSAVTYARRYALAAMVGIAPEDDDGHEASKHIEPPKTTFIPQKTYQPPATNTVSQSQLARLFAIAGQFNWKHEDIHAHMKRVFPGIESTSNLTMTQYNSLVDHIQKNPIPKEKSLQEKTMDAFLEIGFQESQVELIVMKPLKDWDLKDIEILRDKYKEVNPRKK